MKLHEKVKNFLKDECEKVKNFLKDEYVDSQKGSYSEFLRLNREFKFGLKCDKVATEKEFNDVVKDAVDTLCKDMKRFGEDIEIIEPRWKNKIIGSIGSMTIFADDDGKLAVRFHKRNEDRFWDGNSKKYPEKDTEGKFVFHLFFVLEDNEE